MAHTIKLLQGSLTLDLSDGTHTSYHAHAVSISQDPPDMLIHSPDNGDNQVLRAIDGDRLAQVSMSIFGTDDDDVLNKTADLRRWMREGYRHEISKDSTKVQLELKRDSSTNSSYHTIRGGWLSDDSSHMTPEQIANTTTYSRAMTLNIMLTPYGELSSTITLRNDLANSPHFIQNKTSASVADGWAATASAGDVMDTTNYLIGGQSQKCVATSNQHGVRSATVTNTSDTSCVAFGWVIVSSGQLIVTLRDTTGAANLDTQTITTAGVGSDMSMTGPDGNTWYRAVVSSSSFTSGNDVRLEFEADGGASTFNVDAAYLQLGTDTAPNGWASAKHIENRNDPDSSNEDEICYIDVALLPGDAPALARYKISMTTSAADAEGILAFRGRDTSVLIANQEFWLEGEDNTSTVANSGTWSTVVDAARSAGNYERLTEGAGTSGGSLVFKFTGATARQFYHTPRHVYIIAKTDAATVTNVNAKIEMRFGGNIVLFTGETISFQDTTDWQIVDLGALNFAAVLPATVTAAANPLNINLYITVDGAANTELYDIDAAWLPFIEESLTVSTDTTLNTSNDFWLDGFQEAVISDGLNERNQQGSIWQLEPGRICNRFMLQLYEITSPDLNEHKLGNISDVTIEVQPRTRYLMGTK